MNNNIPIELLHVLAILEGGRGIPPGSFHTCLINALIRADSTNRERLRKGFPQYVEAYETWLSGEWRKYYEEN